jgi:hypothetical protein
MSTYPTVELSDDLVVSAILDIGLALLSDLQMLRWLAVTRSESWVVQSGVGKETIQYLVVSWMLSDRLVTEK